MSSVKSVNEEDIEKTVSGLKSKSVLYLDTGDPKTKPFIDKMAEFSKNFSNLQFFRVRARVGKKIMGVSMVPKTSVILSRGSKFFAHFDGAQEAHCKNELEKFNGK